MRREQRRHPPMQGKQRPARTARPSRAVAASGPDLFELAVDGGAPTAGWRTTQILQAPRRFDLVGLRWARGSHLQAQVRARVSGGRWTRWTPLHGDHGPVTGTDPAFTGTADELQLRLRGHARDLRIRFVRALPNAPKRWCGSGSRNAGCHPTGRGRF